jgi:hypothetical protein
MEMEWTMSLDFVPDLDEMQIDGTWRPGRQVRALRSAGSRPVAWATDWGAFDTPGLNWASLSARGDSIGMQPFLFTGPRGGLARPWDDGDLGEPEDITAIDETDAAQILQQLWQSSTPGSTAVESGYNRDQSAERQEVPTPFGSRFPGLAPAVDEELDRDLIWLALHEYGPGTRIGLVPVDRPADILARTGWEGTRERCTASQLAAVLRSWEDRFGARLLHAGPDSIRVLVARPPQTLDAALGIVAEHLALSGSPQDHSRVHEIARGLLGNPFWDFRWTADRHDE